MSAPRPSAASEPSAVATTPVPWRRHVALAAVLYLVVALWALRAVVPRASTALPYPTSLAALRPGNWLELSWNDQKLMTSLLTENARHMMTAPWRLFDNGQCYPTPNSTALGEHVFGMGLRAVVPYTLTRDPVLTTNIVLVWMFWVAGMAMYALVAYWTGDPFAALVAGLVFAFQPARLGNVIHPYIEANEWTVVALLAAHRLFVHGGWIDAVLLTGAIGLQMLDSIYPVLALALVGGTYGLYLMVRFWRHVPALVPKLLMVVAGVALVAAGVFAPYMHMRAAWGNAVAGRDTFLFQLQDFAVGGHAYPGTVTAMLAAVGLADRLRHRRDRRGYDPRLPLLACGSLALAASVRSIPLPFGGSIPSLYMLAARVLPGLDSVRGGAAIGRVTALVATFLAGYGLLALLEGRAPRTRALLTGAVAGAALAELFVPALATYDFGAPVTITAHEVRPAAPVLALYDQLPPGPILDVPFEYGAGGILTYMPHYVFLAAYHHRPIAGCYNSFVVRVQEDLAALVSRLPDRAAVDALAALGFRSIVVHDELLAARGNRQFAQLTSSKTVEHPPDPEATHLRLFDHAEAHTAYVLEHEVATTTSSSAFSVLDEATSTISVRPPRADVFFSFRNTGSTTYRHPPPIEPTWLLLRWYSASGDLLHETRVREMLPLALAPGQTMLRKISVEIAAPPGDYRLTLAPDDAPDVVLARQRLRVVGPAGS